MRKYEQLRTYEVTFRSRNTGMNNTIKVTAFTRYNAIFIAGQRSQECRRVNTEIVSVKWAREFDTLKK